MLATLHQSIIHILSSNHVKFLTKKMYIVITMLFCAFSSINMILLMVDHNFSCVINLEKPLKILY